MKEILSILSLNRFPLCPFPTLSFSVWTHRKTWSPLPPRGSCQVVHKGGFMGNQIGSVLNSHGRIFETQNSISVLNHRTNARFVSLGSDIVLQLSRSPPLPPSSPHFRLADNMAKLAGPRENGSFAWRFPLDSSSYTICAQSR